MAQERIGWKEALGWLKEIIGPDTPYLRLVMVYGVAISLLSLATPISVQLLINSVANTALPAPLWTLSGLLLGLLLLVAGLSAMRFWVMALFERRLFARVVADMTTRVVNAQNPFFSDQGRTDLFNRFFDLVVVQKAVPSMVIGAFTILLQSAVGLAVTSFYHPFFLAFNALLMLVILGIWAIWSRGSIRAAVALSHAKHDAARWLESIGGSNGFYKSSRYFSFAMRRSETVTAAYVDKHQRYFRYTFKQTIGFLLLYALASAALLALGGNLILRNELSIGQLVAAELILSAVFYGISRLGWYLDTLYDLVASAEELSLLYAIPQERVITAPGCAPENSALRLDSVVVDQARFDFELAPGEQLVVCTADGAEQPLAMLLKRHVVPDRGLVMVGGADMAAFDMPLLRSQVIVLNRPTIGEMTIREYLGMASPEVSSSAMLDALTRVGLRGRLASLPQGLDTRLATSGAPLAINEVMALKLANALLVRPRVLMLAQIYDLLPTARLVDVLGQLKEAGTTTLLCTGRPEDISLDGWMFITPTRQERLPDRAALVAATQQQETGHAERG